MSNDIELFCLMFCHHSHLLESIKIRVHLMTWRPAPVSLVMSHNHRPGILQPLELSRTQPSGWGVNIQVLGWSEATETSANLLQGAGRASCPSLALKSCNPSTLHGTMRRKLAAGSRIPASSLPWLTLSAACGPFPQI